METELVRVEKIRCPYCRKVQDARVERAVGWPYFLVMVHKCECGDYIGESEWETVGDKP